MVTLKEIAKECNVSATTVSNILNGRPKVSEETRQKVLEVVHRRGYQPDYIAHAVLVVKERIMPRTVFPLYRIKTKYGPEIFLPGRRIEQIAFFICSKESHGICIAVCRTAGICQIDLSISVKCVRPFIVDGSCHIFPAVKRSGKQYRFTGKLPRGASVSPDEAKGKREHYQKRRLGRSGADPENGWDFSCRRKQNYPGYDISADKACFLCRLVTANKIYKCPPIT